MLTIRCAKKEEIDWINSCYDKVEFMHSNFDKEIIAIAEFDGDKVGLGRLVRIDSDNLELGGMYVFPEYQGKGIAGEIIQFLLQQVTPNQNVYCIPFEHLAFFYKRFGFQDYKDLKSAPQVVTNKYRFCTDKYPTPTTVLFRPHNSRTPQ